MLPLHRPLRQPVLDVPNVMLTLPAPAPPRKWLWSRTAHIADALCSHSASVTSSHFNLLVLLLSLQWGRRRGAWELPALAQQV